MCAFATTFSKDFLNSLTSFINLELSKTFICQEYMYVFNNNYASKVLQSNFVFYMQNESFLYLNLKCIL